MNKEAKTSIVFVILLLLLSLGATTFYYISYEKEKRKGNELLERLNSTQKEKEAIDKKLIMINDEKASLESKIKESYDLIAKLNDKLTEELKLKELIKQEQEGLHKKITELSQEKESAQKSLDEKLKEMAMLQNKLDEALSQKAELEKKFADLPSEVEIPTLVESRFIRKDGVESGDAVNLEKIIVASTDAGVVENKVGREIVEAKGESKRPAISGEVLLTNKEYSFIVINVGAVDGVETGDVFEIVHMGMPLGQVRVEKVHEKMSAANLLPGLNLRQVNEGDVANRID